MRPFTYATVCSGVEGCSLALEAAPPTRGAWEPVFFAEIAPFPSAVLAYRWPDIPNLGDLSKITFRNGAITNGATDIPLPRRLDLLAGGTPCQDFSTAGKRGGAERGSGTRSSLCWEWLRLVAELRPRVVLWENVVGCLSTNGGADFAALVAALDELGYCVAWRVLDCQHTRVDCWPMAIPQRRRRVWLVGCADAGPEDTAQILFEPASLLGCTPPRRETRQAAPSSPQGSAYGTVYPTLLARTQVLSNHGIEGGELVIAEPDHCTLHDTARTIAGNHESRVSDTGSIVLDTINGNGALMPITYGLHASAGSKAGITFGKDVAPTLLVGQTTEILSGRVRRLTPEECERLMGYPEGHTRIPYRGKPAEACPDGPRYEACGNGWAINCARWVLLGIHQYLTTQPRKEKTK